MITFKKLVLSTLAFATLSVATIGTASAEDVIVNNPVVVHVWHCFNIWHQVYNPYTGMFYGVANRVCN